MTLKLSQFSIILMLYVLKSALYRILLCLKIVETHETQCNVKIVEFIFQIYIYKYIYIYIFNIYIYIYIIYIYIYIQYVKCHKIH